MSPERAADDPSERHRRGNGRGRARRAMLRGMSQRISGHAGEQALAALPPLRRRRDVHPQRRSRLAAVRRGAQPGRARGRHAPRADGHVRGRGLRQAHPHARPGRAHRRSRGHQRHLGDHVGPLQRLAAGGARRARPAAPVGRRVAAGARPRADRGLDHQVGRHGVQRRAGRQAGARGGPGRGDAAPRPGVPRLPARRASARPRPSCPTRWQVRGRRARPRRRRPGGGHDRRRRATRGHRRQRRVLGRRVGVAGSAAAEHLRSRATSTAWAGGASRPTTRWRSPAPGACSRPTPTSWWSSARRSTSGSASAASATPRSCTSSTRPRARRRRPRADETARRDARRPSRDRLAEYQDQRGPRGVDRDGP